jgi:hypothetical protein
MTNHKEMRRASNPGQAVRFLSDRLRTSLALMHRGGDDLVPLVLADLPRGSRLLLVSLGALEQDPANASELVLTPEGRELSASCAVTGLPRQVQNDLAALEQERARRAASGEDKSTVEGICIPPNGKRW